MLTIVNYGSGNIRAIGNIYDSLRIEYKVAENAKDLREASKIILPGVGSFDETMGMLNSSGFITELEPLVMQKKVPVLGICVGMQILSNGSDEGSLSGLGWVKGKVKKFDKELITHKPKIPHLGWNSIDIKKQSDIFKGVDPAEGFYFIHSYYFQCESEEDILAQSFYGSPFSCAVNRNNIYGVQFHPEKSHQNGINVLKNFSELPC